MKKIILMIILVVFTSSYAQNTWEKTSCPDNTQTNSIAVNSSGDIFAATDNGLFRSLDHGDNWSNLGINVGIRLVFIGPDDEVFITTNHQGSVLRSTDNGANWDSIGLTSWQNSLAINANGDIFAGTDNYGIYRTTDNGLNWEQINNGLTGTHITSLLINSSQVIFASTIFEGIFRSSDNGENWIQINQGLTANYITTLALNSNGDIFAGTSGHGIFRSTNNGNTWIEINTGIVGENRWIKTVIVGNNGNVFAGTSDGVLHSENNGENWIIINEGLIDHNVRTLSNNPDEVFAGTGGGVFKRLNSITSVNSSDSQIISSFELYQNYPNPFNPETKIKFQIPKESNVEIKIYDILGSEIFGLLNERKEAGVHEIKLNAAHLSSGTYFYKIVAGEFVQIMKMLVLK
jgi:photosystem II stability/assembly factor-like uncharacterized protein